MNIELHPVCSPSGKLITWSGGDNPHLYVSGQSGTGKSFLLKKLACQVAEQNALVLVLDYSGDFKDFMPPDGLNYLCIDVTSSDFELNPLVSLTDQSSAVRAQQLLAALHSIFRTGNRVTLFVYNATTEYLSSSESPTLTGLIDYISKLDNPNKRYDTVKESLELLTNLVHCGNQPISLDFSSPGLAVVDCSKIIDKDFRKLLIEPILQAVWNAHLPQHPPLILVFDEAQKLHWGSSSMSIQILREGRKYGIAGWFSSQWIDDKEAASALGQAAYQVHFRPDEQHINNLAKSICTNKSELPQHKKFIQGLRRGQFIWQQSKGLVLKVSVDP